MIKVLSSSFGLSIQDLGRKGFAEYGVPISGAMDQYSSQLANKLLNNSINDAVLEITNGGCKLRFEQRADICLTGAGYSAKIDGIKIKLNKSLHVEKGSVLSFAKRVYGFRTYLAVKGGLKSKYVLNSRSMYHNITSKSVLQKNDQLPIEPHLYQEKYTTSSVKIDDESFKSELIYCFKGPELDLLNDVQRQQLIHTSFSISTHFSRMGYQLNERLKNSIASMLTSSVLPGTVQLTPSGKLIVLMRDCQVTGGYPRVLQLSESSINRLAQKSVGDHLRFVLIK